MKWMKTWNSRVIGGVCDHRITRNKIGIDGLSSESSEGVAILSGEFTKLLVMQARTIKRTKEKIAKKS
jgi:hypothetical protein